jgi:hypothetical protein
MKKPTAIAIGPLNQLQLSSDGLTMVIRMPISFRRQRGRKCVVTPADASAWSPRPRVDNTLVKALVRAHRWRGMLESNLFASVRDLAAAEKINESYLCRVLRLTLLSPTLTDAILNGNQPENLDLASLLKVIPIEWDQQEALFRLRAHRTTT